MLLSKQDNKHMIGQDNDEEEVLFKVADKRKFNSDGSLKDGVTLEPAKAPTPPAETVATAKEPEPEHSSAAEAEAATEDIADEAGDDDGDIPGAEDPAS